MASHIGAHAAVLDCDREGTIRAVMHDGLDLDAGFTPGRLLPIALARWSLNDGLELVGVAHSEGAAFRPAVGVPLANGRAVPMAALAVARPEGVRVILARSASEAIGCLAHCQGSDAVADAVLRALSALLGPAADALSPPTDASDLLGRLAAEQARLHRQIARQNAELDQRVTERTAALQASEARFRALFEQAAIGIALVDQQGVILAANRALHDILGRPSGELPGRNLPALLQAGDEESGLAAAGTAAPSREGALRFDERPCRRADGAIVWLSVSISSVQAEGDAQPLSIYMVEDVTEQRQTREALSQAERLAVAGRLAASITHEINNPLQAVLGALALAEEALHDGHDVRRYLDVALPELRRLARTVGSLRGLYRPSRLEEKRPTDLNALCKRSVALIAQRAEEQGVTIEFAPAPGLRPFAIVPDRIEQVVLNLTLNALDAQPDGGRLRIELAPTREPHGARLAVSDAGPGFSAEAKARLFQPFFSTKETGLGLGMYICQDIVSRHKGQITVDDAPGGGATVSVWLPG